MRGPLVTLCLVLLPVTVFAQGAAPVPGGNTAPPPSGRLVPPTAGAILTRPNDFPHPVQPWNYYKQEWWQKRLQGAGQAVGYHEVPPQAVTVLVPGPGPAVDSLPLDYQEQTVVIPGYDITETTTGYVYPEHWTLEEPGAGVYQWRLLPAEFRRK